MAKRAHNKRRGRPAPAPSTEQARRLEDVRNDIRRVGSLADFHRRLVEFHREETGQPDAPEPWSYAAVRNYHQGVGRHKGKRVKRDAPLPYLQLVARAFNVNPAWLINGGDHPRTDAEAEAQKAARRSTAEAENPILRTFRDRLPGAGDLAEAMMLRVWGQIRELLRERAQLTGEDVTDETLGNAAAEMTAEAIRAPLVVLGTRIPDSRMHTRVWLEDHVLAIAEPLRVLAKREADWIRGNRTQEQHVAALQQHIQEIADAPKQASKQGRAKRQGGRRRPQQ